MTAIAWTLVGLMAACLGVLASALFAGIARLDARIDSMGSSLDARIDSMGSSLGGRIDTLETGVRGDLRELRQTVHSLDQRLTRAGG